MITAECSWPAATITVRQSNGTVPVGNPSEDRALPLKNCLGTSVCCKCCKRLGCGEDSDEKRHLTDSRPNILHTLGQTIRKSVLTGPLLPGVVAGRNAPSLVPHL